MSIKITSYIFKNTFSLFFYSKFLCSLLLYNSLCILTTTRVSRLFKRAEKRVKRRGGNFCPPRRFRLKSSRERLGGGIIIPAPLSCLGIGFCGIFIPPSRCRFYAAYYLIFLVNWRIYVGQFSVFHSDYSYKNFSNYFSYMTKSDMFNML